MNNKIKGLSLLAVATVLPSTIVLADAVTNTISNIVTWISTVGGALAVLAIVIAGVMMVASQDNADNVKNARDIIKWAMIGLVIILMANALANIVNSLVAK
ncbi:MAG: pilin [Candidatus Pacebacteria bacterium]|nr:pilin [Candidatus Paceibacterota bacterium]